MTTRQAGGIALVLLVISSFLTVVFRSIELLEERSSLTELRGLQDTAVREALTARRQFDALAAGVTRLAAAGDSSAQSILDELHKQGIALSAAKR
jgi:N-acetylglucosamine kinase-like BadF-type ATPase